MAYYSSIQAATKALLDKVFGPVGEPQPVIRRWIVKFPDGATEEIKTGLLRVSKTGALEICPVAMVPRYGEAVRQPERTIANGMWKEFKILKDEPHVEASLSSI